MTERECKIEVRKRDVRAAQVRLQEKKEKMERGIAEAQAVFDSKVVTLKAEWLLAQIELEREQVYLQEAEDVVGSSI